MNYWNQFNVLLYVFHLKVKFTINVAKLSFVQFYYLLNVKYMSIEFFNPLKSVKNCEEIFKGFIFIYNNNL